MQNRHCTHLLQNMLHFDLERGVSKKTMRGLVVVQERGSVMTTEGDEVFVALGLVTLQTARDETVH